MPDAYVAPAAVVAGVLCGSAVMVAARNPRQLKWRWPVPPSLDRAIRRAGWPDTPQRVLVLTVVRSAVLAAIGSSSGLLFGPSAAVTLALAGALAGVGSSAYSLHAAISGRRARLARELAPLLELFILELGGGGSALSALGSVTLQIDGELASELRRLLIASNVLGSQPFESRLNDLAAELQIPAIASVATIVAASREYGTSVAPGVRALASDLRQSQRRELIAHSRRALNHVLFPAAIGVLLPFLCILLFPAVTTLQANLR
jgi:pilus assembly protein TadC